MNLIEKDIMKGLINILNEVLNKEITVMTKEQFDVRLEDLKQLEKDTGIVYANSPSISIKPKILDSLEEVKHNYPMLSFKKVNNIEDIIKFGNDKELVTSIKLTGITISLTYQNGNLISATTKGNGHTGFNITEHIKQFINVPLKINNKGTYIVNGEAIITDKDFIELNKNNQFNDSKEMVSETLASLDTSLVVKRRLNFIVCDVINNKNNSLFDNLREVEEFGFDVIPYWVLNSLNNKNFKSYISYISEYIKEKDYPFEGAVFRFNDIKYGKSLGATNRYFKNGIIYKIKK